MTHQLVDYPGTFTATPEAQATIAYIEAEVTAWYAGTGISIYDVVDAALSLTGLTLTVSMEDDVASIGAR